MNRLFLGVGVAVLVGTIVDLVWTTLWTDGGAGPLSGRLSSWTWRGLRRLGGPRSLALSLAGPLILVFTLAAWVGLLWAGWTFVFAGGEQPLIDTRDAGPLSWSELVYFVAYTMFTMGNGDFAPVDGAWQLATALTTASGMLFVTLGVSYVLSVLGAVVEKRSFAGTVTGIGRQSEAFVRTGWNGEDFSALALPLNTIAAQLSSLATQHKAYPILHYYHSEQGKTSSAVAVAVLDEALTILHNGVPEEDRPDQAIADSARSSTDSYVQTLGNAFIGSADETPPPPDLDRLREADVPTVSDEAFDEAIEDLAERRRKLLGTVRADAWHWPPVGE